MTCAPRNRAEEELAGVPKLLSNTRQDQAMAPEQRSQLRRLAILFLLMLGLLPGRMHAAEDARASDSSLLKENHVATDAESLLQFLRQRMLNEPDRTAVQEQIRRLGSDDFPKRQDASRSLIQRGPQAVPFLQAALSDEDPEIVRRAEQCITTIEVGPGSALPAAVIRLLAHARPRGAVEALLEYAPFADDDIVEDALLTALSQLRDVNSEAALRLALRSPSPPRRAAAAYALAKSKDDRTRAAVQVLLQDPEAQVRLRTAQALTALGDRSAVPVLIDLLVSGPPQIVWQAEDLLLRLADERPPIFAGGGSGKEDQQAHRDAWAAWWKENAAHVDFSRVEQGARYLDLTIVAQMNTGKVWEFGRDGKPRWTLEDLQGPIDARVLPGGRVLVAEHQGNRVTERDLQGKVLWEKKLSSSPITCQRLANGNTFIATYDSVMEIARDGRTIYQHRTAGAGAPNQRIYGAQKSRDGRILAITLEGLLLDIDPLSGKERKSIALGGGANHGYYSIETVPGGTFLVADYNRGRVEEVDGNGRVVWECAVPGAYHASRLASGNTLVSSHSGMRVLEVNRQGHVVWEQSTGSNVWRVHRR